MSYDLKNFNEVLKKSIEKNIQKTDQLIKRFVFDLLARIKEKTPVDTGVLRSDWNIEKIHEKGFNQWYIINSMPYASRIEFEGWSKIKAPNGMVQISIDELLLVYENYLKGLANE
jgi:hypothetical protein